MRVLLKITLKDGTEIDFPQPEEKEKNNLELNKRDDFPEWVKLDYHQCHKCPLKADKFKWCPAAVKIVDIVNAFPDLTSYETVMFRQIWNKAEYKEELSAQDALVQVLLRLMAFSACPEIHADVWSWDYYSPRSTLKSTLFRRLSNKLIAKYISQKKGREYSTHLTSAETLLNIIEKLKERIDNASELKEDAIQNALVILHGVISMINDGYMDFIIDEVAQHFKERPQIITNVKQFK